jgi:hypothetical protein
MKPGETVHATVVPRPAPRGVDDRDTGDANANLQEF